MERVRNISKSMMSYLKRAREYKEFLLKETQEFDRGKRHLANMMGIDAASMTQDDIDVAIAYLFPSGLFDKRARPMMKHPDLLFKRQKEAQFDIEGRPYHHLFFTVKPNYHEALRTISRLAREIQAYEDNQLAKGILDPPPDSKFVSSAREWISHGELCETFLEKVPYDEYEYFIECLKRLAELPYSSRATSLFEEYSKELPGQSINLNLPQLLKDETTGQIYTEIIQKARKHKVWVKTVLNGTGLINIDGNDILYFDQPYVRAAILFPMQISGMIDKVDITAKVVVQPGKLGHSTVAIAIREAVSFSIAAYVNEEIRERMRLAGLLTIDMRVRERKKYNKDGARRAYTWKKR